MFKENSLSSAPPSIFPIKIWANIDESLPPSNIQSIAYKCYALEITKLKHLQVYNTVIVSRGRHSNNNSGTLRKLLDG